MSHEPSLYVRLGGHEGILRLLQAFYADVRQHDVLGPIFNQHITDWPAHLATITEFWAMQTGGPSQYPGGFAGAHMGLGLRPEHFLSWLELWEFNSRRSLAAREAEELNARAQELGRRLQVLIQKKPPFASLPRFFPTSPGQG